MTIAQKLMSLTTKGGILGNRTCGKRQDFLQAPRRSGPLPCCTAFSSYPSATFHHGNPANLMIEPEGGHIPPKRGVGGPQFHLSSLPTKGKMEPQMEFQGSPPSPIPFVRGGGCGHGVHESDPCLQHGRLLLRITRQLTKTRVDLAGMACSAMHARTSGTCVFVFKRGCMCASCMHAWNVM